MENKEEKKKKRTIKGAIKEIIISSIVIVLDFILFCAVAVTYGDNYISKAYKWLPSICLIFGVAFLCLLNGIISILLIKRENKKLKNKENKEELNENNDDVHNLEQ